MPPASNMARKPPEKKDTPSAKRVKVANETTLNDQSAPIQQTNSSQPLQDEQAKVDKIIEREVLNIVDLPDDILRLIFQMPGCCDIVKARGVCKRFRNLIEEHRVEMDFHDTTICSTNVVQIAALFRNLRSLILSDPNLYKPHYHDMHFETVARLHHLQVLKVNYFDNLTDRGLSLLAQGCPELRELHAQDCKRLTDTGMQYLSQCKQIRYLDICCAKITDAGLRHLSRGCEQLAILSISWCVDVTDTGLQHLALGCTKLQQLFVRGCQKLTNAGMQYLALGMQHPSQGCRSLLVMNISDCIQISDHGLLMLSKGCVHLHTLCLNGCKLISDLGVKYLVQGCKQLQTIMLGGCSQVTDASRQLLQSLNCAVYM